MTFLETEILGDEFGFVATKPLPGSRRAVRSRAT